MMWHSFTLIGSLLACCRVQRKQAVMNEEAERLLAEEEGLLDAMSSCQNQRSLLMRYESDEL